MSARTFAALALLATTAMSPAVEVVPARRVAQHDPALYQHGRSRWRGAGRRGPKRADVLAARKRERQARAKQRRAR